MDRLVEKLYRGKVPYDQFAAVVSAHPVLTRRHADAGDKVDALFHLFLGRPALRVRARGHVPRSTGCGTRATTITRCWACACRTRTCASAASTEDNKAVDPVKQGRVHQRAVGLPRAGAHPGCALRLDRQIRELTMWNGLLTADEWAMLQTPGRVLSQEIAFWERAVDDVLERYLGYELSTGGARGARRAGALAAGEPGRHPLRALRGAHLRRLPPVHRRRHAPPRTGGPMGRSSRWTPRCGSTPWLRNTGYRHCQAATTASASRRTCCATAASPATGCCRPRGGRSSTTRATSTRATRSLARTLGGCPENIVGGRFRVVSILTTGTQLSFVGDLCNPTRDAG